MEARRRRLAESWAYHEAGHALMAVRFGHRFQSVTLEPDDGVGGGELVGLCWDPEASPRRRLREVVMILVAGEAAQGLRLNRGRLPDAALADEMTAIAPIDALEPDRPYRPYLDRAYARARAWLAVPAHWAAVSALAAALLERRTLRAEEVRRIVAGAH